MRSPRNKVYMFISHKDIYYLAKKCSSRVYYLKELKACKYYLALKRRQRRGRQRGDGEVHRAPVTKITQPF